VIGGRQVCSFKQQFNPFIYKMEVDSSQGFNRTLDSRLGMAAAVLLSAIEGRRD
jgi:hypothetical protein